MPANLDTQLELAAVLNRALPQTQCTRCGYPSCRDYAVAMASGEADINQCPPGGQTGVERLAQLTGQLARPLNPEHGQEGPRQLAVIDEAWCIGCTLCLDACPVDAIVGAPKLMHTVIQAQCTGCELCVAPCPVDCISLTPVSGTLTAWQAWSPLQAQTARIRFETRQARLQRQTMERQAQLQARGPVIVALAPHAHEPGANAVGPSAVVTAALERARAARQAPVDGTQTQLQLKFP
jgi:Na+-translocating ferredoxin:NAD+ oxidoreductase subunit B